MSRPVPPGRIAFVTPDGYAAALNTDSSRTGGAETQQVRFASGLRSRGWNACLIVALSPDADSSSDLLPEWVEVAYRLREQRSRLGYIYDSLKLFAAMAKSGAGLFIQRCSFHDAPRVRLFSGLLGAGFVFWVGADYNVNREWLWSNLSAVRRTAYLDALQKADAVICQTESQRKALKENFGIPSILVPNIVDIPDRETALSSRKPEARPRALWGGRINRNKRPEELLELAQMTPEWDFLVVALRERELDSEYDGFIEGAKRISNLRVCPAVPHRRYMEMTSDADIVLNTSLMEGFPNTLLEAFARAVPALTLGIDPDGVIERESLGWVAHSTEEASGLMKSLCTEEKLIREAGARALAYVLRSHSPQVTTGMLESLLEGLQGQ